MLSDATTLEFQTDEFATEPGPVRVAGPLEESLAVQIVRMGFATDPIARWVYPDPVNYLNIFPEFIRALAGKAFENGTTYIAADNAGAAARLPPGVAADEDALLSLLETTVSPIVKKDLFPVLEQMSAFHPKEPHWSLPMIAVDPFRTGRGIGSMLMSYALDRCDEERMPAYLESTNPRNITLYQRHGFQAMGIIQSGGSPPMFPMLRRPRPFAQ